MFRACAVTCAMAHAQADETSAEETHSPLQCGVTCPDVPWSVSCSELVEGQQADGSWKRALSQFMSIFGVPRVIQSDQGSNFSSQLFSQILKQLWIKHNQHLPIMHKVKVFLNAFTRH